MAVFNEVLVGRYNRFVQKLLSMKGPASLTQLRGEMGVEIPLFHGAENRYLEGWDLFGIAQGLGAPGVGNTSQVSLRNPAGSNVIAVVTRFQAIDPTASTVAAAGTLALVRGMTTDQNTPTAAQGWDLRGRPAASLILSHNSAAPAATGGVVVNISFFGSTVAGSITDGIPSGLEIPLTPGTGIISASAATNTAFDYAIWWRERFLEDSERA